MVNVESSALTSLFGVHVTRRLALIGGVVLVLVLTTIYLLLDASMASSRAHTLSTNHTCDAPAALLIVFPNVFFFLFFFFFFC